MIKFFFPYPVKHAGMFSERFGLISQLKEEQTNNPDYVFQPSLPTVADIKTIVDLLKKNKLTNDYLGSLFTDNDNWKITASMADLDNLQKGIIEIIDSSQNAYFLTNSAGHHADNEHYELFCPLNHLFFIVEILNLYSNFPKIFWIDIDAHFGNGDKKLFDNYKKRMSHETNNVSGISFHNDAPDIMEENYTGIHYSNSISNNDLLNLFSSKTIIPEGAKYILLFLGTDICGDDYGDNKNITKEIIPSVIAEIKRRVNNTATHLLIVQAGGKKAENIKYLIGTLKK